LNKIRKHPVLQDTHITLCGERNTGHEIQYLSEILAMFQNKSVISQKGNDDEGWWTDAFNKQSQLIDMDRALGTKQIRFLDGWITAYDFAGESAENRQEKISKQFKSELMRYGEREKPTKDPSAPPKIFISGRVAEDGNREDGICDDLAFLSCFSVWLCWLIVRQIAPGPDYDKIFDASTRTSLKMNAANKRKRFNNRTIRF